MGLYWWNLPCDWRIDIHNVERPLEVEIKFQDDRGRKNSID